MHYYKRGRREGKREWRREEREGGVTAKESASSTNEMPNTLGSREGCAAKDVDEEICKSKTHTHREGKGVEPKKSKMKKHKKKMKKKRGKEEDSKTIFMFILQN